MKISKRIFNIKKTDDGYGIFLRSIPEHPVDWYPTKKAAKKRLNEYIKKVRKAG